LIPPLRDIIGIFNGLDYKKLPDPSLIYPARG
jgi:hypothetical protein